MDDWSSVHDRVSKMVGSVMGHCMVGNWMGNSMMGNGVGHGMVGNSMVGNWMGHCMVCNGVGHCMGDRVSQEANTMVSWRMVDRWQVVDSGSHSMVGSVVNCWCGVVNCWCSVVHKWCSVVHNRSSMVHHWSSMVHNWGSMVHKWCSVMHNRGSMVNRWGSVNRSLIIDCLSSVSHFLDHPISTIVVSHSLHSSIGQCDGVRAGGGVAISGLLLLEVCPAVVVIDPVLVGIGRGLTQVLVGSWGSLVLRSWGSQTTADKGQQQGNLGGRGFWRSQWERFRGNNKMEKCERKGLNYFKGKGNDDWVVDNKMSDGSFFVVVADLLDLLRRSPSWWHHTQTWTSAGAKRDPLIRARLPFPRLSCQALPFHR